MRMVKMVNNRKFELIGVKQNIINPMIDDYIINVNGKKTIACHREIISFYNK